MWAPSNRKRSKYWNHVKLIPLHRVNAIWRSSLTLKNQHFSLSPITQFKLQTIWLASENVFFFTSNVIFGENEEQEETKWVEKCRLFKPCVEHRKNCYGKINEYTNCRLCRAVKIKLKFPKRSDAINLCQFVQFTPRCTNRMSGKLDIGH